MDTELLEGRYRLLSPIGSGGMAKVWTAIDEVLDRPVAVKVLELDGADPSAAARFHREAQNTARLSHDNIVSVFNTGVDGSKAFLVMELLAGPTLQARLAQSGPLSVAEAVWVASRWPRR